MLHCNRLDEYLTVTFMGCWKGSSHKWFLVNLGDAPQWLNKHRLSLLIGDKRKSLEETSRLKALVMWVTELHQLGLEGFHYTEGFILW
jgi:hypothetical protein